ncbi:MAG: alkaline phosphatase D family protein [Roseibacillus sp.]
MKSLITLLLLGAVLALRPATAAPQGTAGPLVGNVTPTTATLWIFAPEGAKCSVRANPDGAAADENNAAEGIFTPVAQPAGKAHGKPAKVTLTRLLPNTAYRYTVGIDGKSDPALHGAFRTQPAHGTSNKFRMVLTSCMKFDQPQGSWKHVLAEKPQLHLTVGDTHYADTTNPTTQWEHHLRYRRMPEFAAVLRNIPTYSMWDDHDYGPNNSDRTAKGKENSLAGWNQFWGNPAAGTATTPGAFYKFSWGEVDFFMVDSRYHRSPDDAPDDDKKRMLGDAQFSWLIAGLKSSKAKFKVIASGSTLNHSKADGWRIYTFARHRFFDAIKEHRIPGVVYMSGDIHRSLVWEHHESKRVGYPVVEVISSGVANSKTLSFATIDFDTTAEDPTMRVRVILGDRSIETDRTWKLSQLTHK